MDDWDEVLRSLADDREEFERQKGIAIFSRQGNDFEIELKEVAGEGLSVVSHSDKSSGAHDYVPIASYIQSQILDLPRLARQMTKTLERAASRRPGKFVEGPAEFSEGKDQEKWDASLTNLTRFLGEAAPGATRLVQIMAPAGQGKTVLLENASLESAKGYQPNPYPTPLVLNVDLLGRYVGNIDDAIAGSLNNTFLFPGMSQRDVTLCLRQRWMVLALDGFDELVARLGVRDAYSRVNELLEQLEGSGTILMSARESFFELYEVSAAIRTHLQPTKGSYTTSIIKLLPWEPKQGASFFRGLGSRDPNSDIDALLARFGGDREIVLHPFFLTRLAKLWMDGERFLGAAARTDTISRMRFVIETFVERESQEKWVDRDNNPLLSISGHTTLLGGVAEEMWSSGAFSFDAEELRIAGEFALAELQLTSDRTEAILERLPTHAAFVNTEKRFQFIHDQFLHYFLGHRVAELLRARRFQDLLRLVETRELGPIAVQWATWFCRAKGEPVKPLVVSLLNAISSSTSETAILNISNVCASLLAGADQGKIELASLVFVGNTFSGGLFEQIRFSKCQFWSVDLSGVVFKSCQFSDCKIGGLRVDYGTKLKQCTFDDSPVESIELRDTESLFDPQRISRLLVTLGAKVKSSSTEAAVAKARKVSEDISRCVEIFVRASELTCDVALEEIELASGTKTARTVVRAGTKSGVLREVSKAVSGGKKRFFRFAVDRPLLLRGQARNTGKQEIDDFWAQLIEN